ncbi:arsenate reductase family protein [Streptococcus rubneri]|jgi:transcriptional regulator, spx/mgsR family|uniref:arsenate reductase family protein n=1 Tax=Streptococcus rubneri TaxID=1234680 RepID=UPI00189F308D|nr:arsenate reductase family protein [Streptococcus rubneri]
MLSFIEYPKCSTCRKAKSELNDLGCEFDSQDIVVDTPTSEQLQTWMTESSLPIKSFFNTSGMKYRELGLKDKVDQLSIEEAADLLASDGMLIKRPLLVKDGKVVQVGYRKPYADLGL